MSTARFIGEYRTFAQIRPLLTLEYISVICGSREIPDELCQNELFALAHRLSWAEPRKWNGVLL